MSVRVYQRDDLPQNPGKWDLWVRESGRVDYFDGTDWRPFDPAELSSRVPINVSISPKENVAMDIYVDGEHKLRLYENRNVEFVGGIGLGQEEEE